MSYPSFRASLAVVTLLGSFFLFPSGVLGQSAFPSADSGSRDREGDIDSRSMDFGWGGSQGGAEERLRPPTNTGNWRLGVTVDNTTTGVVVKRVEQNSPASAAGLEPGDVIVAIAGYQVGYVGGRLFDVGEEFRRRVDSRGRVEMLVRDVRRNDLRIINVGLQSASARLAGEVRLSDNRQLPPNSVLQLRLVNRNRPSAEINGGSYTALIGNRRPILFELNVDTSYLRPGESYELQAAISSGRDTLYLLRPALRVDPLNNNNSNLRITMQPASGTIPDTDFGPSIPPNSQQSIITYYQNYLGRTPQQWEIAAWAKHFLKGLPADDLPRSLLVSEEFYDRAGGNANSFIDRMFQVVTGRSPNLTDRNRWLQRYQQLGGRDRTVLVREFWKEYGNR